MRLNRVCFFYMIKTLLLFVVINANGEPLTMQLQIDLDKNSFYFDEEIQLNFTVMNGQKDSLLPKGFTHSNLFAINIFNAENKNISTVNGSAYQQRKSPPHIIRSNSLPTENFTLSANKHYSWKFDFLQLSNPLSPGEYSLTADIYNQEKKLLLKSNQVSFTIKSNNNLKGFDAIIHNTDGISWLLSTFIFDDHIQNHISECNSPDNYFFSNSITNNYHSKNIKPKIAETNLRETDNFDGTITINWKEENQLYSHTFSRIKQINFGISKTTVDANSDLVGRPIVHKDNDISIFLLNEDNEKYNVTINTFNKELKPIANRRIIDLDKKPYDIITSADFNGDIEILISEKPTFPLIHFRFNGETSSKKVLDLPELKLIKSDDTILFTNINSRYYQYPYKSVTAVLLDYATKTKLTTVAIDTAEDEQEIKIIRQYSLPEKITEEIEELILAQSIIIHIGETDDEQFDIITVLGFKGQLFILNTDGSLKEIPTSINAEISKATLIQDGFESVYLVIPEKDGGYKTEVLLSTRSNY